MPKARHQKKSTEQKEWTSSSPTKVCLWIWKGHRCLLVHSSCFLQLVKTSFYSGQGNLNPSCDILNKIYRQSLSATVKSYFIKMALKISRFLLPDLARLPPFLSLSWAVRRRVVLLLSPTPINFFCFIYLFRQSFLFFSSRGICLQVRLLCHDIIMVARLS